MQQAAEVKVGIFVVATVAIGLFVVSQLKGGLGGTRGYEFEIWFQDAPGIGKGSPIRLSGVDIGEVTQKDIVSVNEAVSFSAAPQDQYTTLLPFERVVTWSVGKPGDDDFTSVVVERRRLSGTQRRQQQPYTRERSVARLVLRVKNQFEMFQNYKYEISGGLVFGDKQLTVSDTGPGGVPMSQKERGESIATRRDQGKRVAVLGGAPPSVDKIVGTVQDTIDEETSSRVKQIVANVERATDEAAELIYSMRSTVQGNQGNVDQAMTNIAAASEQIKVGVAEARDLARRSMQNVERVTQTGRRLADSNEARLNRTVQNIERTTASFSRMATENEGRVSQTVEDVHGIVLEVRDMIAANRENFDHVSSQLAAMSDDAAAITGDGREQIQALLSETRAVVADTRRILDESNTQVQALLQTANDAVGNVSAITGDVRAHTAEMTENLRATSDNLRTASENVAALTGDERLGGILDNVEATTAEAHGMIQDVRALTGDTQFQDDIRSTAREVRDLTTNVNRTLGGVAAYRPTLWTDVYYRPDTSRWQGDVGVNILTRGTSSFHLGVSDVTNDPVWTAQLGSRLLDDNLRVRYGFYRGQLGLGADYNAMLGGNLHGEFHDFEDPRFDLRFSYELPWGLTGMVGVEDMFDTFDWIWGIRLGRSLP